MRIARRAVAFFREDRLFAALFGALLLLYTLPLAIPRVLPLQDYAAHPRIVSVWRALDAPDAKLMRSGYERRSALVPYASFYFTMRALGSVMSLEAAQRVILVVYGWALPLGLLYLLLAFGRDRRYALLAFPLIYNTPFIYGLLPQVLSYPMVLFALGLYKRSLDAPSVARDVGLAVLASVLYLTHLVGFTAFGLAAAVMWAGHVRSLRDGLRHGLFALPSLGLLFIWSTSRIASGELEVRFAPPAEKLAQLSPILNDVLLGMVDELALLGLAATLLCALVIGSRERPPRADWTLAGGAMAVLVGYFALPADVLKPNLNLGTSGRLLCVAVLLLCGLPRARLRGRAALVLAPALLTSVVLGATLTSTFTTFGEQAGRIDEVLAKLPAQRRVLPLIYDAHDGVHRGEPLMHIVKLYQVRKGGYLPQAPVTDVAPFRLRGGVATPQPVWRLPKTFHYLLHGAFYHYFFVIYGAGEKVLDAPVGATPAQAKLVAKAGRFALYKNIGPLRPVD
ncbi:MAG: hypothetical protein KC503_25580 [Myxococcales bacterium]|nr:hypothetical protein [Myxococcales bacterium]